MSRRRRREQDIAPAAASSPAPRAHGKRTAAIVRAAIVCAVLAAGLWWHGSQRPATPAPVAQAPIAPPAEANAPAAPAKTPPAAPAFKELQGRWIRPDGGYVVEIKSVAPGGAMETAYFNPKPIHVAKAQASKDGPTTKLFIELRDVNYPGSTYTLTYDPASDRLKGNYFQALLKENFDVFFVRLK